MAYDILKFKIKQKVELWLREVRSPFLSGLRHFELLNSNFLGIVQSHRRLRQSLQQVPESQIIRE